MLKNRTAVAFLIGIVIIISIDLFLDIQQNKKKALLEEARVLKFRQETNLKWKISKENPNFLYELQDHVVDGSRPSTTTVYKEWWISVFAQNNPKIGVIKISPHGFDIELTELDCYSQSIDCQITMIFDHEPKSAWKIEIKNKPDSDLKHVQYNSPEQDDLPDDLIAEKVLNSSHIALIVKRNGFPDVNLNYLTAGLMNPNDYDTYGDFQFY